MNFKYNQKILQVKTSKIRDFNDYAHSIGADVILTLGEPDFPTPDVITQKAMTALSEHKTKYGPTQGNLDLRKKICEFEKSFNDVDYLPSEVIITHGSTEALCATFFTILNSGDEVIVPIPAYPMYRQMVEFIGGKVVTIDTTKTNFQLTLKDLEASITPKTKAIILTSPNNPTGLMLNDASYEAVYQIAKKTKIFVICDEVYNQIVFSNRQIGFLRYKDLKDQIVVCQSYSKSYAMCGWRCGYLLANEEFCRQAIKIHQYMIVALNTFIQPAMIEALDYDTTSMNKIYEQRAEYIYNRLIAMGLEVKKPQGAFYIFPSIAKFNLDSTSFCKQFAKEYKVAIIPGDCFEADEYVRISFCVDFETIKTACDRLEKFITKLGGKNNG